MQKKAHTEPGELSKISTTAFFCKRRLEENPLEIVSKTQGSSVIEAQTDAKNRKRPPTLGGGEMTGKEGELMNDNLGTYLLSLLKFFFGL
jgi:hypothetical protein